MKVHAYEEYVGTTAETHNGGLILKANVARDMVMSMPGSQLANTSVRVDSDKTYRVRRSTDALESAFDTLAEAPLILGHKENGKYDVHREMVGFPIGNPAKTSEATVGLRYKVTDPEAIAAYRNGTVEVSLGYDFDVVPAPEGADYDLSMKDITIDHLAMVDRGRNGSGVRLYEGDQPMTKDEIKELAVALVAAQAEAAKSGGASNQEFDPSVAVSKADHDKALADMQQLFKDKSLVAPLLENDRARKAVDGATSSVEVFAITLGHKREAAESLGADTMRGQALERIEAKANQPDAGDRSTAQEGADDWENLNKPGGGESRSAKGGRKGGNYEAWSPLYDALEARAKAVRSGSLGTVVLDQPHEDRKAA